jgi:hypothetical protein
VEGKAIPTSASMFVSGSENNWLLVHRASNVSGSLFSIEEIDAMTTRSLYLGEGQSTSFLPTIYIVKEQRFVAALIVVISQ